MTMPSFMNTAKQNTTSMLHRSQLQLLQTVHQDEALQPFFS
jgi:hypothetical protein